MSEIIKNIEISSLVPFENHPFKERSGMEQEELLESIKETGLLEPITVRFLSEGKYEIISGHRRVEACKKLGLSKKMCIRDRLLIDMDFQSYNMLKENFG